jgi:hypothetical protein
MRLSLYQSLGQDVPSSDGESSHSSGASLNLSGLCVTAVVNKDDQLKSVTVTLHSHRHSIKVTKLDPHALIRPTSEICPISRFFGGYNYKNMKSFMYILFNLRHNLRILAHKYDAYLLL